MGTHMEFGIFLSFVAISFVTILVYNLFLYNDRLKNNDKEKSNYYLRYMRNKAQVEKNIDFIQDLIASHRCGEDFLGDESGFNVSQHLSKLRSDYEIQYSAEIVKVLKRNKMGRKEKRKYLKLLSNQSEKLYNIEKIVREINNKYKV